MIEIYYVEDDETISQTVKEFLGLQGYHVLVFPTIAAGKKALESRLPDLILIDWNMPDGSGNFLCQWIRSRWKELPVIFLTVRGDSCDMVSGFENGADDYVGKPFDLEVLSLRIRALLRRAGEGSKSYLSCGCLSLDQKRMLVFCGREEVSLSPSEYRLLLYLLQNKGRTVTREKLHQPSCLKTVRSFGYRMEDPE